MEDLKQRKPIIVVIGAQYGSESKGLVVGHLSIEKDADYAVRTGSINAGHTVYYKGKKYVNQVLPTAWVNPKTKLIIGAGAYVNLDILEREVEMINEIMEGDVRDRIFIDPRCGVQSTAHQKMEEKMQLHQNMGSTAKGSMASIIDKMQRSQDYKLLGQRFLKHYQITNTVELLNDAYQNKKQIIIEGTQGALLDFHFGHYPYVTARQTGASAWITECGLPLNFNYTIVSVARTFPIRVAGNSGPMGEEIKWVDLLRSVNKKRAKYNMEPIIREEILAQFAGAERKVLNDHRIQRHPVDMSCRSSEMHSGFLSKFYQLVFDELSDDAKHEMSKILEMTTVTRKVRRIAKFNINELRWSNTLNNPNYFVINFLNYLFPTCWGARTMEELEDSPEWPEIKKYLENFAQIFKHPVLYVNCAPDCIIKLKYTYGAEYL